MSALARASACVALFFVGVTLAAMALVLHQARADVARELGAAQALVDYLGETARRDPASLQPTLTAHLRHVRVQWGGTPAPAKTLGFDQWVEGWLLARPQLPRQLQLADGRQVQISVDPSDELDEIKDSLVQLLWLCGLALLVSLLAIRWAVRRGRQLLGEVLHAMAQVSAGNLQVRLAGHGVPEARRLAEHFNGMVGALQQTRSDNAELTRTLLAVQDRERNTLAQALHDDLGQYLAGIRAQACLLRVVAAQPAAVHATALSLEHNCEQLQQGFRALVRDLYPVVLAHVPLPQAIATLLQQWQGQHHVNCRLWPGPSLPELDVASKAHIYRLLQEALTNIARHADASEVRVRLRRQAGSLRLLVRDNGRGAQLPLRAGVGLHSMHERARSLGGGLRVFSRPGAGWGLLLDIAVEAPCTSC